MRVVWKKGFDQSKVTENNYISLAQFEYAVFFEENYEEEIASGMEKKQPKYGTLLVIGENLFMAFPIKEYILGSS